MAIIYITSKQLYLVLPFLEKNQQRINLCNTKSKFYSSWFLKLWDICWQKPKRRTNAVKSINLFMKYCVTKFQHKKNDKSNSNINITKILHLTFDMVCCLLESMMLWCKMNWQLASRSKIHVVQKCVPSMTKYWLCDVFLYFVM